jgi:hypothetical protein
MSKLTREIQMRLARSRHPKNKSERKLVNDKGRKDTGYIEEPEEHDKDDQFYGHYLPSHFKKTNVIQSYGKS